MKKLICWILTAVMILSLAGCGKAPESEPETSADPGKVVESTRETAAEPTAAEPTTAEPTTAEPTTEAPKTDKTAKSEDVLKNALEALTKDDLKLAFSAEAVLDLSLLYQMPEDTEDRSQAIIAAIVSMLFNGEDSMNIKLEPKADGIIDVKKGISAEVEFKNNLLEKILPRLAAMGLVESDEDPEFAWAKDVIKTTVYTDLEGRKTYFLNPMTGGWNYAEMKEAEPGEKQIAFPEDFETEDLLEKGYEWKITDDQYILSGNINVKELSQQSAGGAGDEMSSLFEDVAVRLTMVFSDEQKLESAEIGMDAFTKDLSELIEGFSIKMNRFTVKVNADYGAKVEFAVPDDVAANAEPFETDEIPGFPDDPDDPFAPGKEYPWSNDVYTLKDDVLLDNESFKLTAKEIRTDEYGDLEVLFVLENKTDKAVVVSLNDLYLNGLKWSGFVNEEADPKASADFRIRIDSYDMENNGQEHVYGLDMFLEIREKDNWLADPLLKDHFRTAVQEGEAEPAAYKNAMLLIGEKDLAAFWNETIRTDEWTGTDLSFFCRNDKDVPVEFEVTKLIINGAEEDDLWWEMKLQPGFAGLCIETVDSDFMKDNGIDEITSLEGVIRVYSEDEDWNETVYEENEFRITYQDGAATVVIDPVKP